MGAVDNYLSLLNAPFGVTSPEELPQGSLQGQVGAAAINNTIKALAGLPKQAIQTSAQDMTHYGDHTKDVSSVGPAFEAARALSGLGAPFAEEGAAGIFGGRLGGGVQRFENSLAAEDMLANGRDPAEVWQETNWGKNPADGKMRFEIPDNDLKLNFFPSQEGETAHASVGALVNHQKLFNSYPDLKFLNLQITKDSSVPTGSGQFATSPTNRYGTISVNAPNVGVARSILAHELQHGVQDIEHFQTGTDPQGLRELIEDGLKRNPSLLQDLAPGASLKDVLDQSYPLYHLTAGEVEPRNVQTRLDWSPQRRVLTPPWYSQDVPYSNQYIIDPVTGMLKALYGNK
jgi:hypothetical protein